MNMPVTMKACERCAELRERELAYYHVSAKNGRLASDVCIDHLDVAVFELMQLVDEVRVKKVIPT